MLIFFGPLYVLMAGLSAYLGGFAELGFTIQHFPQTWEAFGVHPASTVLLFLTGMMTLTIAMEYKNNPKSFLYIMSLWAGFLYAISLTVTGFVMYQLEQWPNLFIVGIGILAFTLFFRPFIKFDVGFAVASLAFVITYFSVYIFFPGVVELISVTGLVLASGIVFIFLWLVLFFIEAGVEFVAKIFNAWPILMALGFVAFAFGFLKILEVFGLSLGLF